MARKPTLWPLNIKGFDKMPKAAMEALADSVIIGTASKPAAHQPRWRLLALGKT